MEFKSYEEYLAELNERRRVQGRRKRDDTPAYRQRYAAQQLLAVLIATQEHVCVVKLDPKYDHAKIQRNVAKAIAEARRAGIKPEGMLP